MSDDQLRIMGEIEAALSSADEIFSNSLKIKVARAKIEQINEALELASMRLMGRVEMTRMVEEAEGLVSDLENWVGQEA